MVKIVNFKISNYKTLHKKNCLPLYGGEAYQMFSQRNNPYCDLLQKLYGKYR